MVLHLLFGGTAQGFICYWLHFLAWGILTFLLALSYHTNKVSTLKYLYHRLDVAFLCLPHIHRGKHLRNITKTVEDFVLSSHHILTVNTAPQNSSCSMHWLNPSLHLICHLYLLIYLLFLFFVHFVYV